MITRRDALTRTTMATAGLAVGATLSGLAQPAGGGATFKLPELPYPMDALEPHVDARTMEIHHDKHHAAYVNNLNKAVAGTDLAKKSIEEVIKNLASVPESIRTAVRNNGGGHYNHALFWQMMKKGGGGEPKGELGKAMGQAFGGFSGFQERFTDAATKVFGSGWAWLTLDGKQLRIESTPNQDSPLTHGREPLLGIDVWEHAYYLKYQNRRPEYIKAWFNVVNWDFVAERYRKMMG